MIFISYNHRSKDLVSKFVKRLQKENLDIWYDVNDVSIGDELSKTIQKGILDSTIVLCFISKLYVTSKNCRSEFFYAYNQSKKCVFIFLEKLNSNENNGLEIYLFGDAIRLDAYKLQKGITIDEDFIENIFKHIAPVLNITCRHFVEIEHKEIVRIKRDYNFIGREEVFKKLEENFVCKKIVLLYGLPGVGKSSCAVEFIRRKYLNGSIKQYFVFYADKMHKIREAVLQYCQQLNLCNETDDTETKFMKFKRYLTNSQDLILFFDNVENFEEVLNLIDFEFLNKTTIITSRKLNKNYPAVEVLPFNLKDTRAYFKKRLPHMCDDDIDNLINYIQVENECLTYKIVLTAGLLSNNPSITVQDLTSHHFNDHYFSSIISKLEKVAKNVTSLLKYACLIDPNEISKQILEKIPMENSLNEVLQELLNYNICRIVNPNSSTFGISIHRILQNDIKKSCFKSEDELNDTIESMANILNNLCPLVESEPDEKWNQATLFYSHIRVLLENNQKKFYPVFADLYIKASLFEKNVNRNFKASLDYLEANLKISRKMFPEDHDKVISLLNNIGLMHRNLGNFEKSLEYYGKSLESAKRLCRGDHQLVATILNNIGSIYKCHKNNEEALNYCQQSLEMYKRLFKGEENEKIATLLNNIGLIFRDIKKNEQAMNFFEDSLKIKRRLFKNDLHESIAITLNSIGSTYDDLDNKDEALRNYQEALIIYQNLFKFDLDEVASLLYSIACIYIKMEKSEIAVKYLHEALKMYQRLYLKSDHHTIAEILNKIGFVNSLDGNNEEALRYYNECLEMKRRLSNNCNNFSVLNLLNKIIGIHKLLGNKFQEETLSIEAKDMKIRIKKTSADKS